MRDLLTAFQRVTQIGNRWTAACPAHEDSRNSLSIGRGEDGRYLVKCHAGCSIEAILTAAHLEIADLFPGNGNGKNGAQPGGVLATYDYRDADGTLLYQIRRFAPKSFRPRRPDGVGGWINNLNATTRVPYRLPELRGQKTVFVVEGEKDADRLWSAGLAATTNAFGAGKFIDAYVDQLRAVGVTLVIVVPDADPPGEAHGRDVARRCSDGGLDVKLLALPELPPKGDISDYLARHTIDELRALVADAPLFDPSRRVAQPPPPLLTSLDDFLIEPDEAHEWIVEDRVPKGGTVLIVAPPKAGKSTLVRHMAVAVARGESWLGWRTTPGRVWLLNFEEKRLVTRRDLRQFGAMAGDPIEIFAGQAPPPDLFAQLEALAAANPPVLIILDTLIRTLNVKDLNDYAQTTTAFVPILQLARHSGAALVCVHHASMHAERDGLNAVLGSTALVGSVDNVFVLRRVEHRRTLSSVQRIGPDLEPTIIELDATSGRPYCAGTKRRVEDDELRDQIVAALKVNGEPITEKDLQKLVEARHKDKVRALRVLLSQHRVSRTGKGGPHDPYRYTLADSSGSQMPSGSGTGGGFSTPREPNETRKSAGNSGLFDDSLHQVPAGTGPMYVVRGAVRGEGIDPDRTYHHDPIQVPTTAKNAHAASAEHDSTPEESETSSGSQIQKRDDDERF